MKRLSRRTAFEHEFVEFVPEEMREGVLYVSVQYGTASHRCACGCGSKVVTPITPTDWTLTFDGETVSLDPSIGNWNFPCQSHYWIRQNRVQWAERWSKERISAGREHDRHRKEQFFSDAAADASQADVDPVVDLRSTDPQTGIWSFLRMLLRGRR